MADATLKSVHFAPNGLPCLALQHTTELLHFDSIKPLGFARFLYRATKDNIARAAVVVRYLSIKPSAGFIGVGPCVLSRRMTVLTRLMPALAVAHANALRRRSVELLVMSSKDNCDSTQKRAKNMLEDVPFVR